MTGSFGLSSGIPLIPAVLCHFMLARDQNPHLSFCIISRFHLYPKTWPRSKWPQEIHVPLTSAGDLTYYSLPKTGEDLISRTDRATSRCRQLSRFSLATERNKSVRSARLYSRTFPPPHSKQRKTGDLREIRPYSLAFSHLIHLTTSSTTDILSDVTDCCNLYSGQPLSKLPESLQGLVSLTHD